MAGAGGAAVVVVVMHVPSGKQQPRRITSIGTQPGFVAGEPSSHGRDKTGGGLLTE